MENIGIKQDSLEEKAIACESQYNGLMELIKRKSQEKVEIAEVEDEILKGLLKLGRLLLEVYVERTGRGDVGTQLKRKNGTILKHEGTNSRQYVSIFGEITIPRSYYLNQGEKGVCPLDADLNLPQRSYSYLLQEWGLKMCAKETFDEAVDDLQKMLGINIPKRSLHQLASESVQEVKGFYREEEPKKDEPEGDILVVCVDGKGVPLRKEELAEEFEGRLKRGEKRQKKKQALVGAIYTVNSADSEEEKKKPRARNKQVIAELEEKEKFSQEILNLCEKRRGGIKRKCFLADGQRSLWEIKRKHFGDYVGVVDFYHVSEYLWEMAYLFLPEGSLEAKKWVEDKEEQLLKGKVGRVIGGWRQMVTKGTIRGKKKRERMEKIIAYFERNKSWMKYDEYIEAGLPIGSGAVESTCKNLIIQRMEGSGMRWRVSGAQAILDLRAVYLNGDWERYWSYYRKKSYQRLYGEIDFLEKVSSAA